MLKLTKITFAEMRTEIESGVKAAYNKAGALFGSASPFGQLLTVVESVGALVFQYLENVASEMNLFTAKYRKSVRGLARIAGHSPFRAVSASGTLRFRLRPTVDVQEEVPGSRMTVFNNTLVKNRSNNLYYMLQIGQDRLTYVVTPGMEFSVNVLQGRFYTQRYTSEGRQLQALQLQTKGFDIENFNVLVTVNGEVWSVRETLRDLRPGERGVAVTTGFNGGVDVMFGNGSYGSVPPAGAIIEVRYLVTDGSRGNLVLDRPNDWDFIDPVLDGNGGQLDVAGLFDVSTELKINFGSDGESIEYTRAMTPYVSRNFVLAQPENYAYFLGALGQFSVINAYTTLDDSDPSDDRTVYLYLVPNLKVFVAGGTNYFDLPEDVFVLDQYEKDKVMRYLKLAGNTVVGTNVQIVDVQVRRYVMFVNMVLYEDAQEESVRMSVLEAVSNYFVTVQRSDRVPKSDLESVIDSLPGVDSVEVLFKGEANEAYHRQGASLSNRSGVTGLGYDSKRLIGFDPVLGDPVLEKNELAVVRGGWQDRQNQYYSPGPRDRGLGAVNITVTGKSRRRPIVP